MTFYFAWRYLRSKKSTNAINIIAWISMIAIAVVTAALVVVLSVFNGFEDLVKQMYGDFYADIQVLPKNGKWLSLTQEQVEKISKIEGVVFVDSIIQERAILLDQQDKSIVWLKGVSTNYQEFNQTSNHMVRGDFFVGDSGLPRLVIGVGVEQSLQVVAGQSPLPVTVYLPNPDAGPIADPTTAMVSSNAFVSGSFAVQQEFDDEFAFTHLSFLQYLLSIPPGQFSTFEIFVEKDGNLSAIKRSIENITGDKVVVKDRFQQNQALFSAMKTEKLIIYAISFLILIIAGFNIISSLTMTVIEKQKDIAVLKALGASEQIVYRIFLTLGVLLAGIGAASGFVAGILICVSQQYFHWVKLAGQSFIISYYPVAVRASDLIVVASITIIIALIAAWIPSRRANESAYSLR